MTENTKRTSSEIASLAARILADAQACAVSKRLAASALAQTGNEKQTSGPLEDLAAAALKNTALNDDTRKLAGSVLAQANKAR